MIIVVTGALGFIGSSLIREINTQYPKANIIAVDDFYKEKKEINLNGKNIREWIHRDLFLNWLEKRIKFVDCIFHLGARTDTLEMNKTIFKKLNVDFSKRIINMCADAGTKLIYASSAATYGNGSLGFSDDHDLIKKLKPLNPYAISKHEVDKYILKQNIDNWYGLKFYNVYGPNEYHKGKMASMVYHTYHQVKESGKVKLFKSHKKSFADGEQKRDYIHVHDVTNVMLHMMEADPKSGIYNVGSGTATSFNTVAKSVGKAMKKPIDIEYINMPMSLRKNYQYLTKADIKKLKKAGYKKKFISVESGIKEYVQKYLSTKRYY